MGEKGKEGKGRNEWERRERKSDVERVEKVGVDGVEGLSRRFSASSSVYFLFSLLLLHVLRQSHFISHSLPSSFSFHLPLLSRNISHIQQTPILSLHPHQLLIHCMNTQLTLFLPTSSHYTSPYRTVLRMYVSYMSGIFDFTGVPAHYLWGINTKYCTLRA